MTEAHDPLPIETYRTDANDGPAWRWQEAVALAMSNRPADHEDDPLIRQTVEYLRALYQAVTPAQRLHVEWQFPIVAVADLIHQDTRDLRPLVWRYLRAGMSDEAIAMKLRTYPEAITTYRLLFGDPGGNCPRRSAPTSAGGIPESAIGADGVPRTWGGSRTA